LDPRIRNTVDGLVGGGRYPSTTAFVIKAICEKRDGEGSPEAGMMRERDALELYPTTPARVERARRVILTALRAALPRLRSPSYAGSSPPAR
jgi:hypothetical protein